MTTFHLGPFHCELSWWWHHSGWDLALGPAYLRSERIFVLSLIVCSLTVLRCTDEPEPRTPTMFDIVDEASTLTEEQWEWAQSALHPTMLQEHMHMLPVTVRWPPDDGTLRQRILPLSPFQFDPHDFRGDFAQGDEREAL